MQRAGTPRVLGVLVAIGSISTPALAQHAPEPGTDATGTDATASGDPSSSTDAMAPVPIVVTHQPPPQPTDGAAVTEITGDRLRSSARASTFEAVAQETPGLHVTSRGLGFHGVASGASGSLHLRGLGGSPNTQVLVMEDGVPDYQGIFGHPVPDAHSSFLIDRVRVLRGGDSTLYGTNALGGVLQIESRRRLEPGWELEHDVAYGSFGTLREQASLLGAGRGWDVAGAITALRSDGHRESAGGSNLVGRASVRWRPTPTLHLTLANKQFLGVGADPGPLTHPHDDHWYEVQRSATSLRLQTVTGGQPVTLVTYLNHGTHRLYDGFFSHDHVAGAYGETELRLGVPLSLLLGLAGDTTGGRVENRAQLEREAVTSLTSAAAYGQVTWRPRPRLEVIAGARGVLSSEYGAIPLFKLAGRARPVEGLALRVRTSRNFRQPTLRELHLPFPVANPELEPERSTSTDAGLELDQGPFTAELTAFRTRSHHLIRYFGAYPTAEVINIDEVTVHGLEGMAAIDELGPFGLTLAGSWQDVGRYTKQNPSHLVRFSWRSVAGSGPNRFIAELSGEWVGGLYQNNYERDPMRDVFFVDATARYRYPLPQRRIELEPYLLARNLLDLRYEYVPGYRMPGLNLLGGLKVTL